jgi:acrylyl-CoA reductase (NADPH)
MTFKALLATKDGEKISTDLVELEEKDLMPGEVTIVVDYSTVNYKDGMAITGRAPIIRAFPICRQPSSLLSCATLRSPASIP